MPLGPKDAPGSNLSSDRDMVHRTRQGLCSCHRTEICSSESRQQVQANLIDPLVSALSPPSESDDLPKPKRLKTSHAEGFPHLLANSCLVPSDEPLDKAQLRKGILEYIFEVASQEDSKDSNRRKLYAICKANLDDDDDL